jgi:hypothetical protein
MFFSFGKLFLFREENGGVWRPQYSNLSNKISLIYITLSAILRLRKGFKLPLIFPIFMIINK